MTFPVGPREPPRGAIVTVGFSQESQRRGPSLFPAEGHGELHKTVPTLMATTKAKAQPYRLIQTGPSQYYRQTQALLFHGLLVTPILNETVRAKTFRRPAGGSGLLRGTQKLVFSDKKKKKKQKDLRRTKKIVVERGGRVVGVEVLVGSGCRVWTEACVEVTSVATGQVCVEIEGNGTARRKKR